MLYVVEARVGVVLVTPDFCKISEGLLHESGVRITRHVVGEYQHVPDYIYKDGAWKDEPSRLSFEQSVKAA